VIFLSNILQPLTKKWRRNQNREGVHLVESLPYGMQLYY